MTIEAQRPTGTPGTAPRGPAGPRPEPTGPKNPSPKPGTQKPPPSSPKGEALDTIADLLRVIALIAADKLPGADPAGRMRLAEGLRTCWSAVADLQTPARRDPEAVATHGGPVQASELVLGRGPTPGPGAAGSAAARSAAAVVAHGAGDYSGRGGKVASPLASPRPVQPPAGRPPASGGDFLLPRDVRSPVAAYGGEGGN
jgi:hypothetical protein